MRVYSAQNAIFDAITVPIPITSHGAQNLNILWQAHNANHGLAEVAVYSEECMDTSTALLVSSVVLVNRRYIHDVAL